MKKENVKNAVALRETSLEFRVPNFNRNEGEKKKASKGLMEGKMWIGQALVTLSI